MQSKMRSEHLELLASITRMTKQLSPMQQDVLISNWTNLLKDDNPAWRYVSARQLAYKTDQGSACLLVLSDDRHPDFDFIGLFAAENVKSGSELLKKAVNDLAGRKLYGPIDLNTIFSYRVKTEGADMFGGEPISPPFYFDCFKQAGFKEQSSYVSAETSLKNVALLEKFKRPVSKMKNDLSLRDITGSEAEMDAVHRVSTEIFNPLAVYNTPFSLEESNFLLQTVLEEPDKFDFIGLYEGSKLVGASLGYIDPFRADRYILKTLGVSREFQGKGVSRLLISSTHNRARNRGCKSIIYALVRDTSRLQRYSRPGVKITARYKSFVAN